MAMVLIVDDEPNIRQLLIEVLEDEGFATLSAANGQIALEVLAAHRVDLVITDTMMPFRSGIDLLRAMRGHPELRAVPAILTSAGVRPDLNGLGVFVFLPKPFHLDLLLAEITAAVSASQEPERGPS